MVQLKKTPEEEFNVDVCSLGVGRHAEPERDSVLEFSPRRLPTTSTHHTRANTIGHTSVDRSADCHGFVNAPLWHVASNAHSDASGSPWRPAQRVQTAAAKGRRRCAARSAKVLGASRRHCGHRASHQSVGVGRVGARARRQVGLAHRVCVCCEQGAECRGAGISRSDACCC
jgi:hypothetical protein